MEHTVSRTEKLDALFGTPIFAVLIAIFCNALWGSAFPFIKMGYRLFAIETADTASILCFAGVRFMLGSLLVLVGSLILEGRLPALPQGKVLAECCALGLWQTTAQYAFYYSAVALLTGAFGGILNSTQSFLGVIFAHFLYGNADRMTPAKALGCVLGFVGVLVGTLGNHGGGSAFGIFAMLLATVIFTLAGPWNKSVTPKLLLLDEHTAALDPATAEKVLELTKSIVAEKKITCLMVTHNMHQALELGNRTLMMDAGRIVFDVKGEERRKMTVDDLLEKFRENAGKALDNDRILLSKVEADN